MIEALTAALYVAVVAVHLDDPLKLVLGVVLVTFLVPIAVIDLDVRKIPNKLTLPAAVLAPVLALAIDPSFVPEQLIAGLAAAFFFFLPVLIHSKGMGMGDVKLAGVLGLYLGAAVGVAILAGLMLGAVVGVAVMARYGVTRGRKTAIPFGPFLAAGALIALLVGEGLMNGYLDRF